MFKSQADKASSLLQELLSFVDSIFQSVFTTRFRDIDAEIRSVIVQNLGAWMLLYPSTFLSSTYLKYLAWALSDKEGSVRFTAVSAIHRVYQDERNAIQLKDFTNRFSDRMTELMEDKDDYVAVAGTELVTMLIHDNHLGSECGRNVFNLLSDPSERLRSAAAELAAGMIKRVGKDAMNGSKVSIAEKKGSKRNQKRSPNAHEHELAGVLSILRSLAEAGGHPMSRLPEKIVYFVVSSLLHKLTCLTNWHLISGWLQGDVPSSLFGDASVHDLAMILLCAAKASIYPGDGKSQISKERKNAQSTAMQELTLLLQKDLESLIRKYQSDPFMISILVRLVPMMKLELYSLKRQEPAFAKLLNLISEAMFKHSDAECVKACSMSLAWCTVAGKSNTRDIASSTFVNAVHEAASGLENAVDVLNQLGSDGVVRMTSDYNQSDGLEESEELYKIRSSLMYVACLLEAQPSALEEDAESCNRLRTVLRLASEGWELPSTTVFDVEKSLLFMLISKISDIKEDDKCNQAAMSLIKDTVSDMFTIIHAIIYTAISEGWKSIAATSAAVLADMITIFSEKSLPLHLKELSYLPLDEDIDAFWNGIENAILDTKLLAPLDAQSTLVPTAIDIAQRLCCSSGIRQFKQLGAKLLSFWEHPSLPMEVSGSFKELIKNIRGVDSTCLPDLYLHAMRLCYNRYCQEVQNFPDETRDEMAEKAIEPFLLLSHKIANSQAGLNAPISTLSYIAEKAALWALEETPRNLEFLQGASYFVVKVKGPEASSILTKLETAGQSAGAPPDTGEDMGDWELFYEYCDVLRSQSQKQKSQGVLKKSTPKSTAKPSRRISFAMDDDFEANVQVSSGDRRRSSRFESARSPNYQETLKDDVDIMDSDVVSPS
jgi:cohesin complex subunit SA-1/2